LIVLDASAAIELVLGTDRSDRIAARALGPAERLHAPHLIDVELAQVLRRLTLARDVTPDRAAQAMADFRSLVIERHAHDVLMPRIWELRSAMSAYDAAYVALAEALGAPLLTCDEKLSRSHGHSAVVELVAETKA
jgi:predicted nucleic acid-binding protein